MVPKFAKLMPVWTIMKSLHGENLQGLNVITRHQPSSVSKGIWMPGLDDFDSQTERLDPDSICEYRPQRRSQDATMQLCDNRKGKH